MYVLAAPLTRSQIASGYTPGLLALPSSSVHPFLWATANTLARAAAFKWRGHTTIVAPPVESCRMSSLPMSLV